MFQNNHAANRLDAVDVISATGETIRLRARRAAADQLLVLKADAPLKIVAAQGAAARLRQGWDGTLGYAHYGLEIDLPGPGEVTIVLAAEPAPDQPVPTSDAELAEFATHFAARLSRFPATSADFAAWQMAYRQKLAAWLMGGGWPRRVAVEPHVLEIKEYPKFTLQRVKYRSQANRTSELLLSRPAGVTAAPLLVALHGHENEWGHAAEAAYTLGQADDFCAYFAERGWAVLQPATMNHTLQHRDWTLQGEWTWDAIIALDYAVTQPWIDPRRIAVCGLSTGAHLAMNLLALDERITAGVVGCIMSTWHHYGRFRVPPHCDCGITQQLAAQLEQCDWAALAAPKPVQFQHGRQDAAFCPGADPAGLNLKWNTGVMPEAEYAVAFAEVQRAYQLVGRPDLVETRYHDGPHSVNNDAAFAWLSIRV